MQAATLALSAIGRALAQAQGLDPRHAIKQVDRMLSNAGLGVDQAQALGVPFVVGARAEFIVALDWTEHDRDRHATLALHLVTSHGRATPFLWKRVSKSRLRGRRAAHEDRLVKRLRAAVSENVKVTVLAEIWIPRDFSSRRCQNTLVSTTTGKAGRIKGGILVSRLRWVRERGGDATVERVLGRLSEADRSVLQQQLLHVCWYPLELNVRLDDAIADELSPGDRRRVFLDMGRASADINLAGPHKVYVHPSDPHSLLSKSPLIYRMYYELGHRTYENTGPKSAVLRTYDAEVTTITDCLTVIGWYERAIELCGGKSVRIVETQCRAEGATFCEYRCEWV